MDVLTNKTAKTSDYYSRNNGFYYYYNKLDKKYQLSTKSWLQEVDSTEVTTYVVKKGDTYDSIALEYYNNPTKYWIICDYNRIVDPFIEPKEGTTLYLPTLGTKLKFESYR